MVTGIQVAEFLGKPGDEHLAALAAEHVGIVSAMAQAYTRGRGFVDGEPKEDVAAVIVTATARMVSNPEQNNVSTSAGPFTRSVGKGFVGWNLAETMVLNRYRSRAC